MENAQAAFQITLLSAVSRTTFLLLTLHPSIMREAAEEYGTLLDWTLTSVIMGEGVGAVGLTSPDEVWTNHISRSGKTG